MNLIHTNNHAYTSYNRYADDNNEFMNNILSKYINDKDFDIDIDVKNDTNLKRPIVNCFSGSMIEWAYKNALDKNNDVDFHIFGDYRYCGGGYFKTYMDKQLPTTQEENVFVRTSILMPLYSYGIKHNLICDRTKNKDCYMHPTTRDNIDDYPLLWSKDYVDKFLNGDIIRINNVPLIRDNKGCLLNDIDICNNVNFIYSVAPLWENNDVFNMNMMYDRYRKVVRNVYRNSKQTNKKRILFTGKFGMGYYIEKNIKDTALQNEIRKNYIDIIKKELTTTSYDEIYLCGIYY